MKLNYTIQVAKRHFEEAGEAALLLKAMKGGGSFSLRIRRNITPHGSISPGIVAIISG